MGELIEALFEVLAEVFIVGGERNPKGCLIFFLILLVIGAIIFVCYNYI